MICHGFPDNQPLKDGDVITIDIGAYYQVYHGDSGRTLDHSICVQYEHTVPITENGPEILTKL